MPYSKKLNQWWWYKNIQSIVQTTGINIPVKHDESKIDPYWITGTSSSDYTYDGTNQYDNC